MISAHRLAPMLGKTLDKVWGILTPFSVSKYNIKCCSLWVWNLFGKKVNHLPSYKFYPHDNLKFLLCSSPSQHKKKITLSSWVFPKPLNSHQCSHKITPIQYYQIIWERKPTGVIKVAGATLNSKYLYLSVLPYLFSGNGWYSDVAKPPMK